MATLKSTIKEELTLNGKDRGTENVFNITGVTESYHRIVTCPASQDTTIATFKEHVYNSDSAFDVENVKYLRVTNLDDTNTVNLCLQISSTENGIADSSCTILLAAQRSFIMGAVHDGIVVDDDNSAIVTSLTDLQAVLIDPSTNEVQVEIFIAS